MIARSRAFLSIAILIAVLVSACDSQEQQNEFSVDASLPPKGFTETDQSGVIKSEDEDDWRTAPLYFGKVQIAPLYPNPETVEFVTVPINILQFDAVQSGFTLRAYDQTLDTLVLLDRMTEINGPGGYSMRFSPAVLGRTGLVRVFVFDAANEIVSYGDLMID
jgi:hypothetical protein